MTLLSLFRVKWLFSITHPLCRKNRNEQKLSGLQKKEEKKKKKKFSPSVILWPLNVRTIVLLPFCCAHISTCVLFMFN